MNSVLCVVGCLLLGAAMARTAKHNSRAASKKQQQPTLTYFASTAPAAPPAALDRAGALSKKEERFGLPGGSTPTGSYKRKQGEDDVVIPYRYVMAPSGEDSPARNTRAKKNLRSFNIALKKAGHGAGPGRGKNPDIREDRAARNTSQGRRDCTTRATINTSGPTPTLYANTSGPGWVAGGSAFGRSTAQWINPPCTLSASAQRLGSRTRGRHHTATHEHDLRGGARHCRPMAMPAGSRCFVSREGAPLRAARKPFPFFGLWLFKKLLFKVQFFKSPSSKTVYGAPKTEHHWRNKPSHLVFAPRSPRATPIRLSPSKFQAFVVDKQQSRHSAKRSFPSW